MKHIFATAAVTLLLVLFAATSTTALPIRIDTCTSTPCNTQGGGVDVVLEFLGFGDLVISATNNLASGAVTQLAFNFEPWEPWINPQTHGFRAVTGIVGSPSVTSFCLNEPDPPGMCTGPFDLRMTFPTSGTSVWGPGETILLALQMRLAPSGPLASVTGFAQVEGACAPSNPAPCLPTGTGGSERYQLATGQPVTVPDGSSTFILAALGFAACVLARRTCRPA